MCSSTKVPEILQTISRNFQILFAATRTTPKLVTILSRTSCFWISVSGLVVRGIGTGLNMNSSIRRKQLSDLIFVCRNLNKKFLCFFFAFRALRFDHVAISFVLIFITITLALLGFHMSCGIRIARINATNYSSHSSL